MDDAFGQMLDAFKQGTSSVYWAHGVGQVRAEAAGIPVTIDRCTG